MVIRSRWKSWRGNCVETRVVQAMLWPLGRARLLRRDGELPQSLRIDREPSRRRRSRVASSGSPGTRIEEVPLRFSERTQSNTASSRSLKGPAVPNLSGETITENIELKVAGLLRGPVCVLAPGNAPASNSQASDRPNPLCSPKPTSAPEGTPNNAEASSVGCPAASRKCSRRYLFAFVECDANLADSPSTGGKVDDDRRALGARKAGREGVGSQPRHRSAERCYRWLAHDVDEVDRHEAGLGALLGPMSDAADMMAVAQAHDAGSEVPRPCNSQHHGVMCHRLPGTLSRFAKQQAAKVERDRKRLVEHKVAVAGAADITRNDPTHGNRARADLLPPDAGR